MSYAFPQHRLARQMTTRDREPLVLVACGSFSPVTYLHLRMFEMAMDSIAQGQRFELLAGYFSPVNDCYNKPGLAKAADRMRMCELAVEPSDWLMVDDWECSRSCYQRSAQVLDHFNNELNIKGGGACMSDGSRRSIRIMLLAGGDLIESFGTPDLWAEEDLHHILSDYGCLIIERTGSDVWGFLLAHDILYTHRKNVFVVKQLIYNDISSTKVRLFVKRGMSIKYLLPDPVVDYIVTNRLYQNDSKETIS